MGTTNNSFNISSQQKEINYPTHLQKQQQQQLPQLPTRQPEDFQNALILKKMNSLLNVPITKSFATQTIQSCVPLHAFQFFRHQLPNYLNFPYFQNSVVNTSNSYNYHLHHHPSHHIVQALLSVRSTDSYNLRLKNVPESSPFALLKDREWMMHGLSGAGAGSITALVTQPLDVTKTVIQVQKQSHLGTFSTLRHIFQSEGVRGCYRGLGTTTMALVPQWGVYFCMYSHFNNLAFNHLGFTDGPSAHVLSATTASLITDIAVAPLWMVKTRLQTQSLTGARKYLNTAHAFRTIFKTEGPRAFYQGLSAQILGISQYAIQFPLYEKLKFWLANRGDKHKTQLSPCELVFASSISKFTACLAAYPHEVLRTRFQHQNKSDPRAYKTLREAVVRIFKEEGLKGFYRGLGTTLLRVTPSAALTFTTYELILRTLQRKSGAESATK